MKKFLVVGIIAFSAFCFVGTAHAIIVPVYNDLWDISNGTTITGSSRILWHGSDHCSNARNMFGANYGTLGNVTYFEDWYYYKGTQWISWQTDDPVTIGSFNLFCVDYGEPRSFSSFELYANNGADLIYTFTPTESFGGIYTGTLATPVTSDNFKAIFGWTHLGGDWNSSVRISELDGFAPVPEPMTMSLLGLGILGLAKFRRRK